MSRSGNSKFRLWFQKFFPERQLYLRSAGEVKFVSVSPLRQAGVVLLGGFVAVWCVYASINTLLQSPLGAIESRANQTKMAKLEKQAREAYVAQRATSDLLERRTQEFDFARVEYERRHDVLENLLAALAGTSYSDTALTADKSGILVTASLDAADKRVSRNTAPVPVTDEAGGPRLAGVYEQQNAFLETANEHIADRTELIRGVFDITPIGDGVLTPVAEQGGPMMKLPPLEVLNEDYEPFDRRVAEIAVRLDEMNRLEKLLTATPLGQPVGTEYRYTSGYGWRRDPINKTRAWHDGIDVASYKRAPITASAPGKVTYVGRKAGYGVTVEIDHGFGFTSRYAHMRSATVKKGETVTLGQKIGAMGNTGRSTGTHLHYEVHFRGKSYDPIKFIRAGHHVHQG